VSLVVCKPVVEDVVQALERSPEIGQRGRRGRQAPRPGCISGPDRGNGPPIGAVQRDADTGAGVSGPRPSPGHVEIHARREDRSLHNFAAHLLRVADGRITEWGMVDAKPSESEEFWA
jgi:hypothetical protein